MSDLSTSRIPRNLIETITKDPRAIRHIESMATDVAENIPTLIDTAQLSADQAQATAESANSTAIAALNASLMEVQASCNALASEVFELEKQIPVDTESVIAALAAELAELKRSGMKPKSTRNLTISMGPGVTSGTYTISPALTGPGVLIYNGVNAGAGTTADALAVSVVLTSSTTVTGQRGVGTGSATVYAQLLEY